MNELDFFVKSISDIKSDSDELNIEQQKKVMKTINEFLFTWHEGIGDVEALGRKFTYISEYHKYWTNNYKQILNIKIDEDKCGLVADRIHEIYKKTDGKILGGIYDTSDLTKEEICRIRFLTANQDFRGSRKFSELIEVYRKNPETFDVDFIVKNPALFVERIGTTKLSQNDKRITFAKNICEYLLERTTTPIKLIEVFDYDLMELRNSLISNKGAGYGNKKTDMFVRDMILLNVWEKYTGFDSIDVASDINTIKVAFRTGIMRSDIPLVSSFLDIFDCQYGYVDQMNAKAWRRVWEIWNERYPEDHLPCPAMFDYFIYNSIGRKICGKHLYIYECESGHVNKWPNGMLRKCKSCGSKISSKKAVYPCNDTDGRIIVNEVIPGFDMCPFSNICDACDRKLEAPKAISILGETGWEKSYSEAGCGGGGIMA